MENFNLNDYIFKDEVETVDVPKGTFWGLVKLVETILNDESKVFYKDKFTYVDENGNPKKKTKQNSNKLRKMFDYERTLKEEGEVMRTEKGQYALELKARLDAIRMVALEDDKMIRRDEAVLAKK